MRIDYTYKIINADKTARCMEIVYTADGHETLHIGARLPYEGEELEAIIRMYAPISYWIEKTKNVIVPEIGYTGSITFDDTPTNANTVQPAINGAQTL